MKLKILAIVVLAVVGLGAAFVALGGLPTGTSAASSYLTRQVATGDITDDVAATGSIAPATSYGLAFGTAAHLSGSTAGTGSTSWTVKDVSVKPGDAVNAGDVLAVADTSDLKRQLENATDSWRVAGIQLTMAEETLDDASGTDQIRQARIGVYNAQAQLSNAQATRRDLRDQIANATLKAPIDGIVTTVSIVDGLVAPSGDAIVIDSSEFQVISEVVESDLGSIKLGQAATVTVGAADADVTGTVSAISPTASEATQQWCRLLPGHGDARRRAAHHPVRDDRRRDDHHRQRDRGAERAGRRPAGYRRLVHGAGHGG